MQKATSSEEPMSYNGHNSWMVSSVAPIEVTSNTLIVLCGPAGAGKSTFARIFVERHRAQGYRLTTIVSSDHCRALICDDEASQQVNRDSFDLFHYIIHKRLLQGRLTIADSTAIQAASRQKLLELAQRHHYQTCLFIFNVSLETCLQQDVQDERGRIVGQEVIAYHQTQLQLALGTIAHEGWDQIHMLDEEHMDVDICIV